MLGSKIIKTISLFLLFILVSCQVKKTQETGVVEGHVPSAYKFTVTTPLNTSYAPASVIPFTLTFPKVVTVTGTPQLTITIGATNRTVNYVSGSGSAVLLFNYTVQAGENDTNGIALSTTLDLNGGTLIYETNKNCATTFTSPTLTTVLVDSTAPTITLVTPPSNGTYIGGGVLNFSFQFSEAVTVTGTPRLPISLTSGTVYADYLSGSGTNTLLFRYTVLTADEDADGLAMQPLELNGGTIVDAVAYNATLTYTPPDTSAVLVAGNTPTITSITPPTNGRYLTSQNVDFTVNFDQTVLVTLTPRIAITLTSGTVYATYVSGGGTSSLLFRYTVAAGEYDSNGITLVSPLEPNGGAIQNVTMTNNAILTYSAPDTSSITIDGLDPVISSVTPPANAWYVLSNNLDFTVNYNYPVVVTGTPKLTMDIGGSAVEASYLSGSGTTALIFRYTVIAAQLDTDGIGTSSPLVLNGGTIMDIFGDNAGLTFTPPTTTGVLVDAISPTISSVTGPSPGTYYNNQNVDFTVTLSENVVVSGSPSISLTVGSSSKNAVYSSGSGSNILIFRYTVANGDLDSDGIINASPIILNGGSIQDVAGNSLSGLTFTPPDTSSVNVDGTVASIISITPPANATYKTSNTMDFVANFTQAVTVSGTPRLQLDIGGVTVYANYLSGSTTSSLTFRYTVLAGDKDTDGHSITSPVDLNGGTIIDGSSNNALLTFTAPDTSAVLVDGVDLVISSITPPADKTYLNAENMDFTVVYNNIAVVTGAPRIQLTVGATTLYADYISGSGTSNLVFRYVVGNSNLDTDGITTVGPNIDLNAGTIKDEFGDNADLAFTGTAYPNKKVDGIVPTISSVTAPANATYLFGENLDFIVTVSEAADVTGSPRLTLTVGATTRYAAYLSGTGTTTLTFRYTVQAGETDADGIAVSSPLDLNSGTLKDLAGNNLNPLTFTPPTTTGVLVDGNAPSILSVTPPANATYITSNNLDFVVNFSQVVDVTGAPGLSLDIGGASVEATYLSGTGTSSLTFRYTVVAGNSDANGIGTTSPLNLNGGSIKNAVLNNAVLTFTSPNTTAVLVDGIDLVISSITPPADDTYVLAENLDFTVNYNYAATVTGTPRIQLTVGAATLYANYLSGSGTSALVFRYTVGSSDIDTDGITTVGPNIDLNAGTIRDSFGDNAALAFTGTNYPNKKVDGIVPTISSVTAPANSTYGESDNLDFIVTTSEAVNVAGSPRLTLTVGATTRYATYLSGTGTTSLTFRYTVPAGDVDADGIVVSSPLGLNSGTMKDLAGNDVNPLTFTPPTTTGVLVDGNAPFITSVTPPSNGTYYTSNNIDFVVNFSQAVDITGAPGISLDVGGSAVQATYLSGTGTTAITFRYTVVAGNADTDGIGNSSPLNLNGGTIQNTALTNANLTFTPPSTAAVLVDGLDIVISSITPPADATYKIADNLDFTVNYNYAATVTGTPRLQLTVGAATVYANYVSGSGTSGHLFRYTVLVNDLDTNGIDTVGPSLDLNGGTIKDIFGDNATITFTGNNYPNKKVDGVRPTISNMTVSPNATYGTGQDIDFTATYSEAVTISGSPRLTLTVGATTRYATYSSGSGTSAIVFKYTVPAGDLDSDGIAVASIVDLAGGTISDSPGNAQTTLTFTPPTTTGVLVDAILPSIVSITPPASQTYGLSANLDFTVTFTEVVNVTGTPTLSLNVGGSSVSASYLSGSGTTDLVFRYTIVANDSDTDGVASVSPINLAGGTIKDGSNTNADLTFTGSTYTGVLVDALPPSISSVTPPGNGSYYPTGTLDFTVTFSENVTVNTTGGTPSINLTIGANTRAANYLSGSGTNALVFRYTLVDGDDDYDGLVANTTLQLNGGTIQDSVSNNTLTNLGGISLSDVFTIPTEMTYWYDLTSTTTVGSSSTTLLQFNSKTSNAMNGSITGTPAYANTGFNTGTSAYTTLSASDYVSLSNQRVKYVIVVLKTPTAAGKTVLYDTTGGGAKAQLTLGTSGTNGLTLGSPCASLCLNYNGISWTTADGSGKIPYVWLTGQYKLLVVDFASINNLGWQVGYNAFDGDIAELIIFTGTTGITDTRINLIKDYLNSKHGVSY